MQGILLRPDIVEEVKRQIWLAGPLFLVGLLQYSIHVISLTFVGHLGELPLSAASMATSFAAVTGFNVLTGMAVGLETLCGQSFGAGHYHMLGIHMQRAMLVLSLMSIFLSIIWANAKPILLAMHQDPQISEEAGIYAWYMIPSLFSLGLLQCLVRFLQTQNNIFPMVLCSGISSLLHAVVCWALVFKSGLGTKGAALANSISSWINVMLLGFYVKFSPDCSKTWTGFSSKAFQHIAAFLRIAIPSTLMLCLKTWTFEIVVILSGLLPNPKLETSVLSICLNTFEIAWMIAFGLGGAVSTRVSNELGAGHPQAARLAASVVLCLATADGVLIGLLMIILRNIWGNVYSNQKEVVTHVARVMPFLAISSFLDAIQSALSGIAIGSGWLKIGAYINLGSFYGVGIPSSIVLAFLLHLKAKGLWLGIIFGFGIQGLILLVITIRTNWVKQADEASKRVQYYEVPSTTISGV